MPPALGPSPLARLFLPLLAIAAPERIAFVDVNVITMESDAVLPHRTVVVSGDRIETIGAVDAVAIPMGARRIEGGGLFLMPGLVDMHVHLNDEFDLLPYVANGVTTVRNLAGFESHVLLRERIAKGEILGPTLFTAGPPVTGLRDPAAAEAIVAAQAEAGFDGVKIYDGISREAYAALVAAARKHGLSPSGHVPRNLRLEDVLAAKPDSIDHLEEYIYSRFEPGLDTSGIARAARETKEAGTAVCTTLVTFDLIGRQVADLAPLLGRFENRYVGPVFRRVWNEGSNSYRRRIPVAQVPELRRRLAFQKRLLAGLRDAGVPILLGTDAGGPPFVLPGFSVHEELAHLVSAGLTPFEALRAATATPAEFLGEGGEFGTIGPGRRADLLLLHGNPLEDVANASLVAGVAARGRYLDAKDLRAKLDELAALRARDEAILGIVAGSGVEAGAQEIAAGRGPVSLLTLNELGFQYLRLEKRAADGLAVLELNTRAFPESAIAWSSYAEVLEETMRMDEALRAWRRVLTLDPKRRDATEAVIRLAR